VKEQAPSGWTGAVVAGHLRPLQRFARALAVAAGPGVFIACLWIVVSANHWAILDDATVYLAAGERLNAGHPLYALSPGDRPVALIPPYWDTPLLAPPPIAVLWRPLASLPGAVGTVLWWSACIAAIVSSCVWLLLNRPVVVGLAMAALALPLAIEINEGNVNGLILGGAVLLWRLRDRPWSGSILGALVALKIWPAYLVFWYVGQGRIRTLGFAAASFLVCVALTIAGAGISNLLDYVEVARRVHISAFSPSELLGWPWLWIACGAVGSLLVVAVKARPAASFAVAAATMVLGSPVINPNTFAVLLACCVPAGARAETPDARQPPSHEMRADRARRSRGGRTGSIRGMIGWRLPGESGCLRHRGGPSGQGARRDG
jgi:hypothetical protein